MDDPVVSVLVAALDPSCDGATLVFAKRLRQAGVSCIADTRHKKIKKIYDWAVVLRCFYVVFLGSNEVAAGVVSVKDLDEKTQETMTPGAAVDLISRMCLTDDERSAVRLRRVVDENIHTRDTLSDDLLDAPPRPLGEPGAEPGPV